MTERLSNPEIVQLDWSDKEGSVTVTPRNQDRYNLKIHQAIKRLEIGGEFSRLDAELQVLCNRLAQWLSGQESVRHALITLRDGGLVFIVVRSAAEYDEEFEDSLTELDIEIAKDKDLSRIKMDVLSLPDASEESLDTFINEDFLISFRHVEDQNAV